MQFFLNILFYFCLINEFLTFPNDLFDELWQNAEHKKVNVNEIHRPELARIGGVKINVAEQQQPYRAVKEESVEEGIHLEAVKVEKEFINQIGEFSGHNLKPEYSSNEDFDEFENVDSSDVGSKYGSNLKRNGRRLSDEEKQRIVNEFIKRKERLAIKLGIAPSWQKTEEIADELGVSIRSIFNWKKEFGLIESNEYFIKKKLNVVKQFEKLKKQNSRMTNSEIAAKLNVTGSHLAQCRKVFHSKKFHTDVEKRELLNQFDEIKRKNPKLSAKNIYKMLSISRETLRRWRKLLDERDKLDAHSCFLGMKLQNFQRTKHEKVGIIGDDEKQRIVKSFLEKKAQLTNELGIAPSWQNVEEIARELGVSIRSIANWKKQVVIIPEKNDGEKGKIEVVKHYKKMKRQNPKMSNKEIATKLGIPRNRLDIYRKQFDPDYQKAKFYDNNTKIELVKQYHQIKQDDPQLPDEEIAKLFNICNASLCLRKKQFAEHVLSDEASES